MKAGDVEISDRMRFVLEILIPAVSLCCLLIVTGYVTNEAIHVLRNPSDDHEKVNIYFLYGFSSANVLVDLLSSYMFFQNGDEDVFLSYRIQKRYNSYNSLVDEMQEGNDNDAKVVSAANLNMISAFTHLTGDSMRTFSVIIAALISTIAKIPSNICDAYAAIVVTITIAFMVIPLIREIWKAMVKSR